jgi:hypothetical protein
VLQICICMVVAASAYTVVTSERFLAFHAAPLQGATQTYVPDEPCLSSANYVWNARVGPALPSVSPMCPLGSQRIFQYMPDTVLYVFSYIITVVLHVTRTAILLVLWKLVIVTHLAAQV